MATTKMAVAIALNGAMSTRWASVASSPSLDGGGYAESGVGNGFACGPDIIEGRYWFPPFGRNRQPGDGRLCNHPASKSI